MDLSRLLLVSCLFNSSVFASDLKTEIHFLLCPPSMAALKEKLDLESADFYQRDLWYADTPSLSLLKESKIIRLRHHVNDSETQLTVKFRNIKFSQVPEEFFDEDFKCENDRYGSQITPGCSANADLDEEDFSDLVDEARNLSKVLSSFQKKFLRRFSQRPLNYNELRLYGPVRAQVWEGELIDSLDAEIELEHWRLRSAKSTQNLYELSVKVKAVEEAKSYAVVLKALKRLKLPLCPAQESKTRATLEFLVAHAKKARNLFGVTRYNNKVRYSAERDGVRVLDLWFYNRTNKEYCSGHVAFNDHQERRVYNHLTKGRAGN